jgi:hypothetical protein
MNRKEKNKMLPNYLTKKLKEKILNGLVASGEWICEVAEPIGEKKDGSDKFEPHIEYMLKAIDEAFTIIADL